MNRAEKTVAVEQLARTFEENPHWILASFRGLNVNQANELRRRIAGAGGHYRVIKNRLAKRAAVGTAMEPLAEKFSGPCGVAWHESDPVTLAKTMTVFAKENPQVEVLAGIVDSADALDVAGVKQLAALPGLDGLRAQILALIQTPATTLLRLIQTPAGQVARVLDARRESLDGGSQE